MKRKLKRVKVAKGIIRRYPDLVEALYLRGEMIRRGAAERVVLANRVEKLERENAQLRSELDADEVAA